MASDQDSGPRVEREKGFFKSYFEGVRWVGECVWIFARFAVGMTVAMAFVTMVLFLPGISMVAIGVIPATSTTPAETLLFFGSIVIWNLVVVSPAVYAIAKNNIVTSGQVIKFVYGWDNV